MKRTWVSMVVGGLFAATAGSVVAQEESTAIAEQKVTSGKPAIADAAEFTPQQRAVLAEKLRLVSEIVARMEPQARADGLAPGWRQSTMSTLYALSNETLAGMMGVRSVNDLPDAIAHAKRVAPKALGSSTEDVVYTPITPCRYIDTRDVGGKISGTRSYDLDLNSYTFSAIKCASDPYGIFGSTLAAVAVNLAIVDPSGAPGFATIVPHQAATNVALMNWYEAGPTVQASNSAIVTINPGGLAPEIDIQYFRTRARDRRRLRRVPRFRRDRAAVLEHREHRDASPRRRQLLTERRRLPYGIHLGQRQLPHEQLQFGELRQRRGEHRRRRLPGNEYLRRDDHDERLAVVLPRAWQVGSS